MQPDGLLANRIPQPPDRRLRQDEAIEMESQPSCSRLQMHLPQFSRCLVVFVNIPENEVEGFCLPGVHPAALLQVFQTI